MKRFSILVAVIAILALPALSFAGALSTNTTVGSIDITPFTIAIPTGVTTTSDMPFSNVSLLNVGMPLMSLFGGNATIAFSGKDIMANGVTTATTLIPGGQNTGFTAFSTISSEYAGSITGTILIGP